MKKSFALSKSTVVPNNKETNNANMPNQFSRMKNVAKGEDVIKDYGIPSALRRDNTKPEMSQCVKDIHRYLIIDDQ
jgi:hypothetical protein